MHSVACYSNLVLCFIMRNVLVISAFGESLYALAVSLFILTWTLCCSSPNTESPVDLHKLVNKQQLSVSLRLEPFSFSPTRRKWLVFQFAEPLRDVKGCQSY